MDEYPDMELAKATLPDLPKGTHDTVTALLRTLALHHHEKVGHCQRVARQCDQLARLLGLKAGERSHLFLAARLHDIGVIGVPASILDKPGPLTEEEWVEVRRHPEHAFRILASLPAFQQANRIIYCHHEEWGGHGYPRGLKGQRIPIGARILAVVDVWDALQSKRPYRAAWSRAEAKSYLHEQSGAQFDPIVASAFLKVII